MGCVCMYVSVYVSSMSDVSVNVVVCQVSVGVSAVSDMNAVDV